MLIRLIRQLYRLRYKDKQLFANAIHLWSKIHVLNEKRFLFAFSATRIITSFIKFDGGKQEV